MATHEPYGSAADIPSIADMLQKIEGGKPLTRFIARDQRAKLVELEQQVRAHIVVIDRLYAILGPRNWIVHDELPMPLLAAVGGMAAERRAAAGRLLPRPRELGASHPTTLAPRAPC